MVDRESIETRSRHARRGGRYPAGAPTVAVGLAGRLRCDARITRAAAMPLAVALIAPLPHGFSPVRRRAVGGCASAATLCGAEERRARGRAHEVRASTSDTRRLFERSERSEFR